MFTHLGFGLGLRLQHDFGSDTFKVIPPDVSVTAFGGIELLLCALLDVVKYGLIARVSEPCLLIPPANIGRRIMASAYVWWSECWPSTPWTGRSVKVGRWVAVGPEVRHGVVSKESVLGLCTS